MAIDRARYYAVTWEHVPDTSDTFSVVPLEDVRWFIDGAGLRFLQRRKPKNDEESRLRHSLADEFGSGYGFRLLATYTRGGESYVTARAGILKDKGPAGDWARRKINERAIPQSWDMPRAS